MLVHNSDVSALFRRVADLLDIRGENPFRVRAYRMAARTVDNLTQNIGDLVKNGAKITRLPGIGDDLAGKITEIVTTGKLRQLERLQRKTPGDLSEMMKIKGLGPKRVHQLYTEMDLRSLKDLETAAKQGRLRQLEGFGKKTEKQILQGLAYHARQGLRHKLKDVEQPVSALLQYFQTDPEITSVDVAGSYRRRKTTAGDIDILLTGENAAPVMDRFTSYEDVSRVLSKGKTRSSVVLRSGLQVDVRFVPPESRGAAMLYLTGSKAHNIALRKLAVEQKLRINEYGVFKGKKRIAGRTEHDVYEALGMPFIAPELREDRGEISAAQNNCLPELIRLENIRGDLHVHTTVTDGLHDLEKMAAAARKRGYEYLAITEHSRRVKIAHGLDAHGLEKHIRRIDRLNQTSDVVLLKGIEVDILKDGTLDLPDRILEKLDITLCAVHSHFDLPRKKQTDRIIRAMKNPNVNVVAHPSGRLINKRAPYAVDMDRIIAAAARFGCMLELNAQPDRLDLTDVYCRAAKEAGVQIVISTDAHCMEDLDHMRFGIGQARRGWLRPEDVINTLPLKKLRGRVKR